MYIYIYIWVEREGRDLKDVYKMIKIFHNHIQRQAIKKKGETRNSSLVLEYAARVGGKICVSRPLDYEQENWENREEIL